MTAGWVLHQTNATKRRPGLVVPAAGVATSLVFAVQPVPVGPGSISPAVQVNVVDAFGSLVASSTASITLALSTNPSGGTLTGSLTLSASGGIATFGDLVVDTPGVGYTLAATSIGLATGISATFTITSIPLATVPFYPNRALASFVVAGTLLIPRRYVTLPSVVLVPVAGGVTRDIGSASGGSVLDVRGYNFTPDASATIGGAAAATTFINSTRLRVTSPPGSAGSRDIVITQAGGTSILAGAFEYVAAASTTWAQSTFSAGSLGPFTVNGNVTTSTDFAEPGGTQSAKCVGDGGTSTEHSLQLALPPNSSAFQGAAGVWAHYHLLLPDTVTARILGQIKLTLIRNGDQTLGWWNTGVGPDFASDPPPTSGFGLGITAGKSDHQSGVDMQGCRCGTYFKSARWVEVLYWYHRAGGVGRVRSFLGINGALKAVGDSSHAGAGDDTTTTVYNPRVGIVFQQNNTVGTGNIVVYVGNLWYADGLLV